jgi:hypothetical protein
MTTRIGTIALAALGILPCCFGASITLASHSGGVFDYNLVTDNSGITLNPNFPVIVLSGLSGVTGASVSGTLAGLGNGFCSLQVSSFNSTSVTVSNGNLGICAFGSNISIGTLEVDSSISTVGTVNFALENSTPNGSGTTQGPVPASTPEPATLALSLVGLSAFAIVARGHRRA